MDSLLSRVRRDSGDTGATRGVADSAIDDDEVGDLSG